MDLIFLLDSKSHLTVLFISAFETAFFSTSIFNFNPFQNDRSNLKILTYPLCQVEENGARDRAGRKGKRSGDGGAQNSEDPTHDNFEVRTAPDMYPDKF